MVIKCVTQTKEMKLLILKKSKYFQKNEEEKKEMHSD